ncbi:MAG: hypothetical protein HYT87_06120 [Nitrospirae bacterium]|nr:hypothetical protein [Nitrospirota bacterium]
MSFYKASDTSNFVISFTRDPKGDFSAFAKGYTRAANRLAAALLGGPRFPDYEAYPVVFLYRHALELSLKHIIYGGAELAAYRCMDEINEQLQINHNLAELSRVAGKVLSLLFPNDEMLNRVNATVAAICADWSKIDPGSFAYRYPIVTKGLPTTERNQTVSLRALSTHMAAVLEDLDTVQFGLDMETYKAQELYGILEQFVPSGRAH